MKIHLSTARKISYKNKNTHVRTPVNSSLIFYYFMGYDNIDIIELVKMISPMGSFATDFRFVKAWSRLNGDVIEESVLPDLRSPVPHVPREYNIVTFRIFFSSSRNHIKPFKS